MLAPRFGGAYHDLKGGNWLVVVAFVTVQWLGPRVWLRFKKPAKWGRFIISPRLFGGQDERYRGARRKAAWKGGDDVGHQQGAGRHQVHLKDGHSSSYGATGGRC